MKNLLFILFLGCFQIQSQETMNFKIQNQDLIWQKVYETELSEEGILDLLQITGVFELASSIKNGFTGRIFNLDADFKKFGLPSLFTPGYITENSIEGFMIVEFKEKKCRITIKNIKLVSNRIKEDTLSTGVSNLEIYALKKLNSEFRDSFLNKPAKIFNLTFENLIVLEYHVDKNW